MKTITQNQKQIVCKIGKGAVVLGGAAVISMCAYKYGLRSGALMGTIMGRVWGKLGDNAELLDKAMKEFSNAKNIFEAVAISEKYCSMV